MVAPGSIPRAFSQALAHGAKSARRGGFSSLSRGRIAESYHRSIEQGAEYAWPLLKEPAPELPLVSPCLGLDTEELDYQSTVQKVGPGSTQVRNGVENQRANYGWTAPAKRIALFVADANLAQIWK
jgi:hypothetical protein